MRFRSMAAAGVPGAPFNGTPFPTFQANVANLIKVYEADPSKTFAATLGSDASPGDYGGTDFFASIMMRLAARHGGQGFLSRFWHGALAEPVAGSTTSAVTNLVAAASKAACVDLSSVFYDRWGFPRPNGTITPRPPANTVPEPVGRCCPPATQLARTEKQRLGWVRLRRRGLHPALHSSQGGDNRSAVREIPGNCTCSGITSLPSMRVDPQLWPNSCTGSCRIGLPGTLECKPVVASLRVV